MKANREAAWWRIIDWRLVGAAGIPVWLVIAGLVVWAKAHPRTAPPGDAVDSGGKLVFCPPPQSKEVAPMARLIREELPWPRAVREVAALPRPVAELAPPPRAAEVVAAGNGVVVDGIVFVTGVFGNLLDNMAQPRAKVVPAKPVPEGCKTHGTTIHFTKSTVEAMKRAKTQDKLVFVLHLSGNIEDDGFT